MKRQVRFGVYETNSSSTHALVMCAKEDYDRWQKDGLYLFQGNPMLYLGIDQPKCNEFYTKKEVLGFLSRYLHRLPPNFNWDNDDEVEDLIHELKWYDYDYYWNVRADEYEEFEHVHETKSGEQIVAFGYYGYC